MRRLFPIITVLGALIFAIAIAEVFVRVFLLSQPVFEFSGEKPWEYEYTRNSDGYREDELSDEVARESDTRILFLGDSFTYGHGVNDKEVRFPELIESRLNAGDAANGHRFHVYNAGLPGTAPHIWIDDLKKLLPRYRPDYVFAVFFLRDGTNLCTSMHCYEKRIRNLKVKFYYDHPLLRHSAVWRYYSGHQVRERFARGLVLSAQLGGSRRG